MARSLHVIDHSTPTDMLNQLALLVGKSDLVVSAGPPPQCVELTLPVKVLPRPLGVGMLSGWAMRDAAGELDVVHAWSIEALSAASVAAKHHNCKVILSLPTAAAGKGLGKLIPSIRKGNLTVTVGTEASRQAMLRRGAAVGGVAVLPPAAERISNPRARRRAARQAMGLGKEEFLITASAAMTRQAGHKYACWTHAILRQVLGNIRLCLPGGGPIAANVRSFASTTGYDGEIFFTGSVLEMPDILAATDAAVFLHERDCGVSALAAAMAAGLPIVAAATPDTAECAPHEEAALLVAPGDPRAASQALLRLIENPEAARAIGNSARDRAKEYFDPTGCREHLENIYAQSPPGAAT